MLVVKNVLVAVDFDDASEAALTYGRNLARSFGARLHVLHVIENSFLRAMANDPRAVESATIRQVQDRLTDADRAELDAVAAVRKSDEPAEEIVRYATGEHIDLVVLGTHGRSAVGHFLVGSVAERVVRTAPCPVLTVRHPEREFIVAESEVGDDRAEEHSRRD
jgi:nucleotide-binding universal stress UspA family protein